MKDYYAKKIFEQDPFATIDQDGVGKLVGMGVALGKKTRPNIDLGICGEHGGDPASIDFCHRVGLTYVSCSPESYKKFLNSYCKHLFYMIHYILMN